MKQNQNILVTGGSGFFGGVLKRRLLSEGYAVTNIDLVADTDTHPALTSIRGDIRDAALLDSIFAKGDFRAVLHCAALLAHDTVDDNDLWTSNVDGTRNIAEACRTHGVRQLVFTSTNCLWASNLGHEVREDEPPNPVELYGRSKLAAEQALKPYETELNIITIRCPTIIDSGRLGLLAILFEFIDDGKKVWVVGTGGNRYQFIYAQDLATACIQAMAYPHSDLFHIGSENVCSLREVYEAVIRDAGTKARVAQLPKAPTIAAMKLAHKLGVSPLGPYHYRMIAEDFIFDTTRIRERLGWRPTVTNQQMMIEAYRYYSSQRRQIHSRKEVSAHSKPAEMGVIRLLKWLS
ncbi:NAD-dependent epimerase/dehydratase family protein [Edaphobacter albus]|uniref:NAD-dependent epimerase/dehydratase family protein n=1 Tax=Edaphobacter sp. 4G125 TaxID=2763071 RepID=UPI001648A3D7|nr:NAD(P)-dependent oxidoreductase [Edaphobacter sp. 4G125]QNI36731.1 NAD(P)-dependent oxidoreductase [Edaphobacter sp. 4G125]